MGADLSAYSMLPEYLENMGGMIPAQMNVALYNQPTYTANYHALTKSIEQVVERKIKEGASYETYLVDMDEATKHPSFQTKGHEVNSD